MGYLISDKQFTVQFGGDVGSRTFMVGVSKDVTPEMAEHWYVKAAGAQYVERLEDAHKSSPTALASVRQARSQWEQAMRESVRAEIAQLSLRRDLERLEQEFGVDTRAADAALEESMSEDLARIRSLSREVGEGQSAPPSEPAKAPEPLKTEPAKADATKAAEPAKADDKAKK